MVGATAGGMGGSSTLISLEKELETPKLSEATRVTVYRPIAGNSCVGSASVDVPLSPKFHA